MHIILKKIPEPKHGFEPTLDEIIYGSEDKGYPAHPELETDPRFTEWLRAARVLENMVKNFGIHAGGIVISDKPISDIMPVWFKRDKEKGPDGRNRTVEKHITQYDMKEVEDLGLIKFDFLGIDNLSILKETCRLIKETTGKTVDPYALPDGDVKAYTMLQQGLVTGIFQMETSGSAKELIRRIAPRSIAELSDVSALNRPGPMSAGLHDAYIDNKNNGYAPGDHPDRDWETSNEFFG